MTIKTLLYHSGMAGVPSATLRAAGGLTDLLNACLVDGMSVTALTGVTRSGSTATYAVSGTNPFQLTEVVEISGFDQSQYNGRFYVTARDASSISVTVTGSPVSPGTGTGLSAKRPAAGWSKTVVSTNTVAYQSAAGSMQRWMQVEDNNPYGDSGTHSRTRLAGVWTALDTADSLGEICKIQKLNDWVLVADDRTCHIVMGSQYVFYFGEFSTYNGSDTYNVFQTRGEIGDSSGGIFNGRTFPRGIYTLGGNGSTNAPGVTFLRADSQLPGYLSGHVLESLDLSLVGSGTYLRYQGLGLPNAADNSVPLQPLFVVQADGPGVLRGRFRGMYWPLCQLVSFAFTNNVARLDDAVIGGATRSIVVCRFGMGSSHQIAFDLGNW